MISRLNFEYEKEREVSVKSVVLKIPSLSPNYDIIKQTNMYKKEVYMYEKIFPQIYQLWTTDAFTPVVYNTVPESGIIIMEDLSKEGFVSKHLTTQLDFEHCTLALQTLAEFHAVSFKYLQSKNPRDIPECMHHGMEDAPSIRVYMDFLFDKFLQIVSSLQHHSMIKKLTDFKANFWGYWKKRMSPDIEALSHWQYIIQILRQEAGRIFKNRRLATFGHRIPGC